MRWPEWTFAAIASVTGLARLATCLLYRTCCRGSGRLRGRRRLEAEAPAARSGVRFLWSLTFGALGDSVLGLMGNDVA